MDESLGNNIAGPSLIRVPKWIMNPLGRYYLYFSAHKGDFIRLTYADRLEGPWQIYKKGTLQLEESLFPTTPSKQTVEITQDPRYKGPDDSMPHNLKETLGDRVAFLGAIDGSNILNFGTPKEVYKEVKRCIKAAAQGGGYFAGPSHNVLNAPWENILALRAAIEKLPFKFSLKLQLGLLLAK